MTSSALPGPKKSSGCPGTGTRSAPPTPPPSGSAPCTSPCSTGSAPSPGPTLAGHCGLSPRQFTRQFRQATGTTPHQWLLTQRLALAQRLLETTGQSIDHVAADAGFGTPAALRLQFQKALDTSPAAYRRTFRVSSAV
jgi:transcriptional regulator GlxA family with amidase domain